MVPDNFIGPVNAFYGRLHLFQYCQSMTTTDNGIIFTVSTLYGPPIFFQEEDLPPEMPVTHDSMRLIDQAKAICEQRIYLDEAKELYSLISSKWMRVGQQLHFQLIYFKFALGTRWL